MNQLNQLNQPVYLTRNDLYRRGWSAKQIQAHLGPPDHWLEKYHTVTGQLHQRTPVYLAERVAQAELRPEFEAWLRASIAARLKESASKTSACRAQASRRLAAVKAIFYVRVDERCWEEAFVRATAHWAEYRRAKGLLAGPGPGWQNVGPDVLRRWCFNFYRHRRSNYDQIVAQHQGMDGMRFLTDWMRAEVVQRVERALGESFSEAYERISLSLRRGSPALAGKDRREPIIL